MAWYAQRFKLASAGAASTAATDITGGGAISGITFPASTKAISVGSQVLAVHDDDTVAEEVSVLPQYREGTKSDSRDDLTLEGMGITTLSHLLAVSAALSA